MRNPIKNNQKRAQYALMALWLLIIQKIMAIIFFELMYNTFGLQNLLSIEKEQVSMFMFSIISLMLFIHLIAIVCFIRWVHRAYLNLHRLDIRLIHSPNWAIIGWFIPINNWFIPFQILIEISRETQRAAKAPYSDNTNRIFLCWILYIGSIFFYFLGIFLLGAEIQYISLMYFASTVEMIIIYLIITIMKKINVFERILFNRMKDLK